MTADEKFASIVKVYASDHIEVSRVPLIPAVVCHTISLFGGLIRFTYYRCAACQGTLKQYKRKWLFHRSPGCEFADRVMVRKEEEK